MLRLLPRKLGAGLRFSRNARVSGGVAMLSSTFPSYYQMDTSAKWLSGAFTSRFQGADTNSNIDFTLARMMEPALSVTTTNAAREIISI